MVTRSIPKQLFGTLVAVLVGWLVTLTFLEFSYFLDALRERRPLDVGLVVGSSIATSWFMTYFVIPVWLFVLIPLYLFVPLSSPLWHWPICMVCGAPANHTQRLVASSERVLVGASGTYEARCRHCFDPRLGQ